MQVLRNTQKIAMTSALFLFLFTTSSFAQVGNPLPAFSFQSPDGTTYTNDTFKGKVLLIFLLGHN